MTYHAPDIDQISLLAILLKSPFPVPGSLPVTAEGKCKIRFLTNPKHTSMIARISHEIIASTKWHKSVKQWKVTRTDIQANSRWPCTDRRKPAELIERLSERVRYQPGGYMYVLTMDCDVKHWQDGWAFRCNSMGYRLRKIMRLEVLQSSLANCSPANCPPSPIAPS
jgi:hypothetical protein